MVLDAQPPQRARKGPAPVRTLIYPYETSLTTSQKDLTAEEKEARRLDDNIKRAMPRRDPKHPYRTKRAANKEAKAPVLATEAARAHLKTFAEIADLFLRIRTKANSDLPNLEKLKRIVAISRAFDGLVPLADNDELWRILAPIADLLISIAQNPLTVDVEHWVEAKVLVREDVPVTHPSQAVLYLRFALFKDTPAMRAGFFKYLRERRGDAAWTLFILALLGTSQEEIEAAIAGSEVAGDVAEFFKGADKELFEKLSLAIPPDAMLGLLYVGYTIAQTIIDRVLQDMMSVEGNSSRNTNARAVMGFDIAAFRIARVALPVKSALDVRSNALIGRVEDVLIKCCSPVSLNSAPGGFDIERQLSVPVQKIIQRLQERCPPFSHGTSIDTGLSATMASLLRDESSSVSRESGETIHASVLANTVKIAGGDMVLTENGSAITAVIMKDATKQFLERYCDGHFDATAGESLKAERRVLHILHPELPLEGDLSLDHIARFCGPHLDLHTFSTDHETDRDGLHLCRKLYWLRPLCARVWSAKVAWLFLNRLLLRLPKSNDDPNMTAFLAGTTPDDIRSILNRNPSLNNAAGFEGDEFSSFWGKMLITSFWGDEDDLFIMIIMPHYGRMKYNPITAKYCYDILALCEAVNYALCTIIFRKLRMKPCPARGRRAFLQECIDETLPLLADAGVYEALADQIEHLRSLERTILRLRHCVRDFPEEYVPRPPPDPSSRVCAVGIKGSEERLAQLNSKFAEADRLDALGFFNAFKLWPYGKTKDEFEEWWVTKLEEGIDVMESRRVFGNSAEAAASARANHMRLGAYRRQRAIERRAIDNNGSSLAIVQEREKCLETLIQAVRDLSDPGVMRNFKGEMSTTAKGHHGVARRDYYQYGTCPRCARVIVAKDRNHVHFCSDGKEYSLIDEFFRIGLCILTHSDTIFNTPALLALLGPAHTPEWFGLVRLDVGAHLVLIADTLPRSCRPRLESIPSSLKSYVVPNSSDDWKRYCALRGALPHLLTCDVRFNATLTVDSDKTWQGQTFNPIWETLSGKDDLALHRCRCRLGATTKLAKQQRSKLNAMHFSHSCVEGQPCAGKKRKIGGYVNWVPEKVNEFFNLPLAYAERALYYCYVQQPSGFRVEGWVA